MYISQHIKDNDKACTVVGLSGRMEPGKSQPETLKNDEYKYICNVYTVSGYYKYYVANQYSITFLKIQLQWIWIGFFAAHECNSAVICFKSYM